MIVSVAVLVTEVAASDAPRAALNVDSILFVSSIKSEVEGDTSSYYHE